MQEHSELLKQLLETRGIVGDKEVDLFLNPDYERDLLDPYLMRDMERACVRMFEAIDNNQKVVIYADYDCDGIPGAVIMQDFFSLIEYQNFEVYIPQRNSEGYGLNMEAIKIFRDNGVKLLFTIDLGITAVEEVAQAEVLGIDTIITDHHIPHAILPRAYAILNPKVDDYPEKMLCGAGVAFKFVQGFIKKYGEFYKIKGGAEKWMLDMAGLATLSDMVPLLGENRALAYYGLKVFRKSPRPGLQKLLKKMNIDQRTISEDDIAFMVTPKINVASRMDDPRRAFELLSTRDVVEGGMLADHLSKINEDRKYIVSGIMREVKKIFETRKTNESMHEVIVIGSSSWKVGVLGLVAGKIMDEYEKPVFVWGKDENDAIKGSCRSPGSVSLVELMTETSDSFLEFGGHEMAGGFTVQNDKVHFLEEVLSKAFLKVKRENNVADNNFDIKADLESVNMKVWNDLEKLSPYGCENQKPVFLFEAVEIKKIKKFGKNGSGEHLEIIFSNGKKEVKAISFFSGLESFSKDISEGGKASLLATFDLSRFGGKTELRLRVVDII
ncbi:MAG: single-stranded-DNA-specific exonuclease [Patescibacteria group bacterium]|nr:single-stranded-DNA-specific exonuclease [Patescibacteria group bacterium]